MFHKFFSPLVSAALLLASAVLQAAPLIVPAPPQVAAEGYLLVDHDSGQVLAEKNADTRMEPASLTKMMTAYIVSHELLAGRIKLDDMVTVSKKAWQAGGSRMFIEVNTRVSVEDLMKGVIIQSGNDASIALAEHLAGSEEAFATVMNQYATRLGMQNTHFVNSTGLPHPDHYTTPRDLSILARSLIRDDPEHYGWYSIREMKYNGIKQHNRNRLLWRDETVDGIKTGHTESAGYCLVASAKRNGMRLISLVLGAGSESGREQAALQLLNFGFRFYETHNVLAAGAAAITVPLWKGAQDSLPLGVKTDLYVTVPRGRQGALKQVLNHRSYVVAPVQQGEEVGTLVIQFGEETLAQRPLVALQEGAPGSFWRRLIDGIKLFFYGLFK